MAFNNIKIIGTIVFCLLFFTIKSYSQGKFAGEFNKSLGLVFITEEDIPQLKSFTYQGGSIISDLEIIDSYYLSLDVYRKGSTAVVVMSKLIDKVTREHRIIEILKIMDVPKNYEIRISGCTSININSDDKIVAVYYIGNKKNVKLIKEAYVLKDIRFEKINSKTITCINEIEID